MKILVVFTGGTIGSRLQNGWISPHGDTKFALIENYKTSFLDDAEFVSVEPYYTLSENLSAKEINLLISCVLDNIEVGYDGIIVTHGTDTLQYTAAALSYAVGNCPLPIMLVSANYPLDHPRSNGMDNFNGAVQFIKQKKGNGVYISYKNPEDELKFHSGLSALSHGESDDSIHSLYGKHYGLLYGGEIRINEKPKLFPSLSPFTLCENPNILVINAMPGDSFCYDITKYKAIIMRPYHSGTLNTKSDAFKLFCQRAKTQGVPVFVTNLHEGETYESSKLYEEFGIIPLPCRTFTDAYIRLWIGISKNENLKYLF
jgi:L-asparaginase